LKEAVNATEAGFEVTGNGVDPTKLRYLVGFMRANDDRFLVFPEAIWLGWIIRTFADSSFLHQRESSHLLKRMDTRPCGYDGKGRQANVLIMKGSSRVSVERVTQNGLWRAAPALGGVDTYKIIVFLMLIRASLRLLDMINILKQ